MRRRRRDGAVRPSPHSRPGAAPQRHRACSHHGRHVEAGAPSPSLHRHDELFRFRQPMLSPHRNEKDVARPLLPALRLGPVVERSTMTQPAPLRSHLAGGHLRRTPWWTYCTDGESLREGREESQLGSMGSVDGVEIGWTEPQTRGLGGYVILNLFSPAGLPARAKQRRAHPRRTDSTEANVLCVETKGGKTGRPLALHPRQTNRPGFLGGSEVVPGVGEIEALVGQGEVRDNRVSEGDRQRRPVVE